MLNRLLTGAWEKYVEALATDTKLELEAHYGAWVATALDDAGIQVTVDDPAEAA